MRREIRAGTVTLRGLMTISRGGKTYRYLRIKGKPLTALPDLPIDHPDFLAAYAAARQATGKPPKAPRGTVQALIEAFLASRQYRDLSDQYRRVIRREIEAIRAQADDAKTCDLRPHHIRADLLPLDPNKARARMKAWRKLCDFGIASGLMQINPTEGVARPKPEKTAGHPPWTVAEIAAYRAKWPYGTAQRAAMELLLWTGARTVDAVTLGPGMVDHDGVLTYRQSKTTDLAHAPWTCKIPRYAAPDDRDHMHKALAAMPRQMTYLSTNAGASRTVKGLGNLIAAAAKAAGVPKSAHGLRKTRAVALADGGATPHEIGAWTGHKSLSEVERYTRAANRRAMVMGTEQDQNSANTATQGANKAGSR